MANLPWDKLSRKIQQAKINNYVSGTVEISFNIYGPTLGFAGVLTALTKMLFIQSISAEIWRKKDGATYQFNWFAFRPPEVPLQTHSGPDLKSPKKFMLFKDTPYHYSILFSDHEYYSYMNSIIKNIVNKWQATLQMEPGKPPDILFTDLMEQGYFDIEASELSDLSYWEQGQYQINILVETEKPHKRLEVKYDFDLSGEHEKKLKENVPTILADTCRQNRQRYFNAYLPLKPAQQ